MQISKNLYREIIIILTQPYENNKKIPVTKGASLISYIPLSLGKLLPENILKRNCLVQKECTDLQIITKDILIYSAERRQNSYIKNFISSLKKVIDNIPTIDEGFLI